MMIKTVTIKVDDWNKYFDQFQEVNNEPSKTVPDDSYTIAELFLRAQQGLPITDRSMDAVYNEDYYHESEDLDYDLADYSSAIHNLRLRRTQAKEEAETVEEKQSETQEVAGFDGAEDVAKDK